MVRSTTSWICGKCNKRFRSYREAEGCEIDHIVKDAADGFREDLAKILNIDAIDAIARHEHRKDLNHD